jgi:hypothetical protein
LDVGILLCVNGPIIKSLESLYLKYKTEVSNWGKKIVGPEIKLVFTVYAHTRPGAPPNEEWNLPLDFGDKYKYYGTFVIIDVAEDGIIKALQFTNYRNIVGVSPLYHYFTPTRTGLYHKQGITTFIGLVESLAFLKPNFGKWDDRN